MLISSLFFYHFFKSYFIPVNERKKRIYNDWKSEIQEIFSNCSPENDNQIRSSNIIETISLKYGLNDELKNALENKLDPQHVDLMYSKDDLFNIFKDWISSGLAIENSLHPFKGFNLNCHASTPVTHINSVRRLTTPARLMILEDHCSFGIDELATEMTPSSSSAKKKLTYRQCLLESRIDIYEKHASSIEKKYECILHENELLRQEIERLKKELKTYHEAEQVMEEISEIRRKEELEIEKKYAKTQSELNSANSHIADLDLLVSNLKQAIELGEEKAKRLEVELHYERENVKQLQNNNKIINEDLLKELTASKQLISANDLAISKLLEENSALSNEVNELRNSALLCHLPEAEVIGIPLCEELPSEMMRFPLNSAGSTLNISCNNNNRYKIITEMQSVCIQTDFSNLPSVSSQWRASTVCSITGSLDDVRLIREPSVNNFSTETCSIPSHTDNLDTNFKYLPVEFNPKSSSSNAQLFSSPTIIPVAACCSQNVKSTNIFTKLKPNSSLIENIPLISKSCQTELNFILYPETFSQISQTEIRTVSNPTQTMLPEMRSCYSQTKLMNTHNNFSQTDVKLMLSQSSQTKMRSRLYSDHHLIQIFNQTINFGRLIFKWTFRTFGIIFSFIIALLAVCFTVLLVCQNNNCQLQLKYDRGSPPV